MNDNLEYKKLILEHVLYEMTKYLRTLNMLDEPDINKFDTIWECHLIHLRNLIEFYTKGKRCILCGDVLDDTDSLELNFKDLKPAWEIASKTVSHLTKERFEESKYTDNAKNEINKAKKLIVPAIRKFIIKLPDKIKEEYREELSIQKIINDIRAVERLLEITSKTNVRPRFATTASVSELQSVKLIP